MTALDPIATPWLPPPSERDRALLRAEAVPPDALARLAGLAWDEAGLVRLAKRIPPGTAGQRVLLIGSGTVAPLALPLRAAALRHGLDLDLDVTVIEHEEPGAALARLAGEGKRFDVAVLWLDARGYGLSAPLGDAAAERDALAKAAARLDAVRAEAGRLAPVVIPATLPAPADAPRGALEMTIPGSPRRLAASFNAEIHARGGFIADWAALAEDVGLTRWHAGRAGAVARHMAHPRVLPLLADRLATVIAAALGRARKALVLDLDGTLWGGTLGDDGIAGLEVAPGTARGDAHRAVQAYALRMKARGVVLAVLSRNDPDAVADAFRDLPGLILSADDIAVFDLGWEPKPARLARIATQLNLAPEALVVLDDDPVQRAEMRAFVPGAFVVDLPRDPADWPLLLEQAAPFVAGSFTAADAGRTADLRAGAARAALAEAAPDRAAFLRDLAMTLRVERVDAASLPRVAQLIARTNQFNLTLRRRDAAVLAALLADPATVAVQASLSDRFGDSGLIGVMICRTEADGAGTIDNWTIDNWMIETWAMSCRVLGRGVEDALFVAVRDAARAAGATALHGHYVSGPRNGLVANLYARLGFEPRGDTPDGMAFRLDLADPAAHRPAPDSIAVVSTLTKEEHTGSPAP